MNWNLPCRWLVFSAVLLSGRAPVHAAPHPVLGDIADGPAVVTARDAARSLIFGADGKPTAINAATEAALVKWWHALKPAGTADYFADAKHQATLAALQGDPALTNPMAVFMEPQDKPAAAWKILCTLQEAAPAQVAKYPLVAVAFALTHDDPHNFITHQPQAPRESRVIGKETVTERFVRYLEDGEAGKLLYKPASLTFTKLKFVVGHDMPFEEMDWARKNVDVKLGTLGKKTFYSIQYDHPRLKSQQFSWPHGPYTLASIRKNGGICADQAYYGTIIGKAWGIPTMYFHGQGQRGSHAWLGYLKSSTLWDFEEGRYAYDNYTVGNTTDPQTGESITDAWLDYFAADVEPHREFTQASLLLKWVRAYPDEPGGADLLRATIRWMPDYLPAWQTLGSLMDKEEPFQQDVFWRSWLQHFVNSPEVLFEGNRRYLVLLEAQKRESDAASLRRKMLEQTLQGRVDLRIRMARFIAQRLIEAGRYEEAGDVAETATVKLSERTRGLFIQGFLRPVVKDLLKKQQRAAAEAIFKKAERRIGKSGGNDWADLVNDMKGSG